MFWSADALMFCFVLKGRKCTKAEEPSLEEDERHPNIQVLEGNCVFGVLKLECFASVWRGEGVPQAEEPSGGRREAPKQSSF